MDDALVERWPWCIQCGQAARSIETVLLSGRVLAISRCTRCVAQDKEAVRLIARLSQREAKPAV